MVHEYMKTLGSEILWIPFQIILCGECLLPPTSDGVSSLAVKMSRSTLYLVEMMCGREISSLLIQNLTVSVT